MKQVSVVVLQMNSQEHPRHNAEWILEQIQKAESKGHERASHTAFIMAPENALFCGRSEKLDEAAHEIKTNVLPWMSEAYQGRCPLILGGVPIKTSASKYFNCWIEIKNGSWKKKYVKRNLFQSSVPGQRVYDETLLFRAGPAKQSLLTVSIGSQVYKMGPSICFDLRFPHLYQQYTKAGAQFLAVPSAFTRLTGEAHWHTLLRARAIENQCFIVAPAQTGRHPGQRETFGHSLVVNPWGEVLLDAGTETGCFRVALNMDEIAQVRQRMDCGFKA